MKNIHYAFRKRLLTHSLLLLPLLCSFRLVAQEEIIFKKPEEVKSEVLNFDRKGDSLVKTFNLFNESGFKKSDTQKWEFDTSVFMISRKKINYTKRGYSRFNDSLDIHRISFKPNFSNKKIQRLQFFPENTDKLVYNAICKYPYLIVNESPIVFELDNIKDRIKTDSITIKNIGYETLKVHIKSSKNDFISVDTTYVIQTNSSKNIDFKFDYPKSYNKETFQNNEKRIDSINEVVTLSFVNTDFPENTIEKKVNIKLSWKSKTENVFNYFYLLFLLLPVIGLLFFLRRRKSFKTYKKHLHHYYTKNKNDEFTVEEGFEKFIINEKHVSSEKIEYYLEQTILFTKGEILVNDLSSLVEKIKDKEKKDIVITHHKSQKETYLTNLFPNKKTKNNTSDKKVIESILRGFLENSFTVISNRIGTKKLHPNSIDTVIEETVTQVTNTFKKDNDNKKITIQLIKETKQKTNIASDKDAINLLSKTFAVCDNLKKREIISKLKNGWSVEDCIQHIEKDTLELVRVKEKLNFSDAYKSLEDHVEEIIRNKEALKQQLLHLSNEKMLMTILNHLYIIIDGVKNKLGWLPPFKNAFFRSLGDENGRIRKLLKDNRNSEISSEIKQITLQDLAHTISEFFRIYAFSLVQKKYVRNNFIDTSFPVEEYQSNILILKGLIQIIYDVEIIIPNLFEDTFNSEKHKKTDGGLSEVMRNAPSDVFYDMKGQTIVDFDSILFKSHTENTGDKIKVFTK